MVLNCCESGTCSRSLHNNEVIGDLSSYSLHSKTSLRVDLMLKKPVSNMFFDNLFFFVN